MDSFDIHLVLLRMLPLPVLYVFVLSTCVYLQTGN
jgi:hypothetical protein